MLAGASLDAAVRYAAAQAQALYSAWCTYFLIYWTSAVAPAAILVAALLVLGTGAALARLRANRLDGWYSVIYLAVLLLWPYPGQLVRMLFPLLPVLLAQAAWAGTRQFSAPARRRLVLLGGIVATATQVLPAHAFLHGRVDLARQQGLVPTYEWLRKPDLTEALHDLVVENRIISDIAALRDTTRPDEVICYYEPSYVALLAERRSVASGFPPSLASCARAGPEPVAWLLVSAIHPRMSRAGLDALRVPVDAGGEPWSHCTRSAVTGAPATCLMRAAGRR
jgi:hypothetical protein